VTYIQNPIDRKSNAGHLGAFRHSEIRLDTCAGEALKYSEVKGCQARILRNYFFGGWGEPQSGTALNWV